MMTEVEPRPASGEPRPGRSPRRVPGGRQAVGTVALVGGALAATLYPVVVAVDGATRADGYRPAEHWVSLLSRGERAWLGTTALVVTGVLLFAAGLGLRSRLPAARSSLASRCVVALGAAFLVAGACPIDPVRTYPIGSPALAPSVVGTLHSVAGCAVVLLLATMCWAGSGLFHGMPATRRWRRFSYGCACVVAGSASAAVVLALAAGGNWEVARAGLFQRVSLAAGLVWLATACAVAAGAHPRSEVPDRRE